MGVPPRVCQPASHYPGAASLARLGAGDLRSFATAVEQVRPENILALGTVGLQGLGLTRQKASNACGLAMRVLEGQLALDRLGHYGDDDAREHLMRVRGIGLWTANIYLLMALRRPDIWPSGDLALHKALGRLDGTGRVPSSGEAEQLAARWRPLRAVAARILWHAYLAERAA